MALNFMMASNKILTNRYNHQALALVLACLFHVIPVHATESQSDLQHGIQSYNSKDFHDAVGHLQMHLHTVPNDAVARYYLANALQSLGYEDSSLTEYERALQLSRSPQLSTYCRQAIERVNTARQYRTTGQTITTNIQPSAFGYLQTGALQDLNLSKALNRMKEQSNEMIEINSRNGAAEERSIADHSLADIDRLGRDRDARIQALLDGPQFSKGKSSSSAADAAITRLRTDTDIQIANIKTLAAEMIKQHEQESLERGEKFQSDVQEWQSQLAEAHKMRGQPGLQAIGSDLYTRVYNTSPSEARKEPQIPDELLATPGRLLLDYHTRPGRTISRVVRDPSFAARSPSPGPDLNVRGQVIKQY
jgi:tetratricopeptide (TPR) repeat protein